MMLAPDRLDRGITSAAKTIGLLCVGAIIGGYLHQTAYTDKAAEVLPQVQKQAGCEEWRANKNGKLALDTTVVTKDQLAKDTCPHPRVPSVPLDEHPAAK